MDKPLPNYRYATGAVRTARNHSDFSLSADGTKAFFQVGSDRFAAYPRDGGSYVLARPVASVSAKAIDWRDGDFLVIEAGFRSASDALLRAGDLIPSPT